MIFLITILGIYTLTHSFLYYQTRPIFQLSTYGAYLKLTFWILVLAYPAGRFAEFLFGGAIPEWTVKIGSVWLAFMLYLTLLFLLFLIASPIVEYIWQINLKTFPIRIYIIVGTYLITSLIVFCGYLNARYPINTYLTIKTHKNLVKDTLKIVAVSDIHLGTIIGRETLQRMAKTIQQHEPDLVLLVGDIFDEDIAPVINGNVGEVFHSLSQKFPIYAITGNHEFIRGANPKIEFLRNHGITVLLDTSINLPNLNIIGRIDRQSVLMSGQARKSLPELLKEIDLNKFTILLDHQPYNLKESADARIDLQLSGHTHHGQLWPLNAITNAIFEVSRGYKKIAETHFYVSTGYGTWGPRVRIGNKPEIVFITLTN